MSTALESTLGRAIRFPVAMELNSNTIPSTSLQQEVKATATLLSTGKSAV